MKSQRKIAQEVAACLRADDIEGAARRVLDALGPGVHGYLRVALADERAAEDAYHRFSSAVWQKLRRLPAEPSLEVLVYRLGYRSARQQRETSRPQRGDTDRLSELRELGRTQPATLEPLGLVQDAALMRAELSLEEQTLLTLRLDRQFEWRDIGAVLGRGNAQSTSVVRDRFARLTLRLHRSAVTRGLLPADSLARKPAASRASPRGKAATSPSAARKPAPLRILTRRGSRGP